MRLSLNHLLLLPFLLAAAYLQTLSGDALPAIAAAGGSVALVVVGLWATSTLPEHITSLLFFIFAMVFGIAAAPEVFAGFTAGAFWLLFGGMILGTAVGRTGLGARLARAMAFWFGRSYTGVIIGIVAVALVLSFVMPSATGRAVLLMPVALSLAEAYRFGPSSNGRLGITIAAALSAVIPGFGILPANVPNLVMVGAAESIYGLSITYAEFLLLNFPILGLLKAAMIIVLIRVIFPDRLPVEQAVQEATGPLSGEEKRLTIILLGALILWATDFLHGVSPSWVALLAGVLCMMRPFSLIPSDQIGQAIQLKALLFIAGVLSLGPVVMATGFAAWLADGFLSFAPLQPGQDWTNFTTIVGASVLTSLLGTAPTVPAVWTPLAEGIASASGLPLKSVILMQMLAFSTVILPYQVPPVVVALQLGQVPIKHGIIATLAVAAGTIFILLPLDFLWWQMLGMFDG